MDNTPNRRIEDKRAAGGLQWDDLRAGALTAKLAPSRPADRYVFTITPRAEHVGGGWRLQLFEDGQEVSGGVYPVTDEMTRDDAHAEAMADGEAWISSRGTDGEVPPKDEEALTEPLTDEDITVIWQTMPGGQAGWLKSFGFLQFARAVEEEVIGRCRAQGGNTNDITSSPAAPSTASIEGLTPDHRAAIEGVLQMLESGAAHNRAKGRTVLVHTQQGHIDRLRAVLDATQSAKQGAQPDNWPDFIKSCGYVETAPGKFTKPTASQAAPEQAEPSYWNSQRKMIERAIVGLRDGWATRQDADAALAVLGSSYAAPAAQVQADVRDEAEKLAPILRGMCEGGGEERDVDIYADDYQAGDGDTFVIRAAQLLEEVSAMESKRAASTDGEGADHA